MSEDNITVNSQEDFDNFSNPLFVIKKAFSSFSVVLVTASGVLLSFLLGLIYLVGWFNTVSLNWLLIGLVLLMLVFPVGFGVMAYYYGRNVILGLCYEEIIRPLFARFIPHIFDKLLNGKGENEAENDSIAENILKEDIEGLEEDIKNRIPGFLHSYLGFFSIGKDVYTVIQQNRKNGKVDESLKRKVTEQVFDRLDEQMAANLPKPSIRNSIIMMIVNILVFLFLIA